MSTALEIPDEITLLGMIMRVLTDHRKIYGAKAHVRGYDPCRHYPSGTSAFSCREYGVGETIFSCPCAAAADYLRASGVEEAYRSLSPLTVTMTDSLRFTFSQYGTSQPTPLEHRHRWTDQEQKCLADLADALREGASLSHLTPSGEEAAVYRLVLPENTPQLHYMRRYGDPRTACQRPCGTATHAAERFLGWCGSVDAARAALASALARLAG